MMQKKKNAVFFVKLISLLLVVAAALGVIDHFYVNGYYYYSVYNEIDAMYNVPFDIKMTNVGTSHGLCSFRYDENDGTGYNLALSGSDIYHNFATLRQFADHLSPGCIVAIPTSYFSFCMSTDEPSQKRYYLYLDREYIRDFRYETLINAKYMPVLHSGEFLIKDLIRDQDIDAAEMMEETPVSAPVQNTGSTEEKTSDTDALHNDLVRHAAGRSQSWRLAYMQPNGKYAAANTELLTEMIRFCLDRGFRPVLVTTPVYCALNEEFSDEELDTYYFSNVKAAAGQTGVPYLDLSHDGELSAEPGYYENSDHLNDAGAARFMEKYHAFLRDIGYIN